MRPWYGGPAIAAGAVLAVLGMGLIVVGAVKVATCRNVFGVALYRWATGEGALGPFSDEDLRGAGAPRTAEAIRAGLDKEFDKFTIWPDEERVQRAA